MATAPAPSSGQFLRFSADFATDGQVAVEDLKKIADAGFKSVMNMRMPDEGTFVPTEAQTYTDLGVSYEACPVGAGKWTPQFVASCVGKLEQLPKPVFVHCAGGTRASVPVVAYDAKKNGKTFSEVEEWYNSSPYKTTPEMAAALKEYLEQKL